MAMTNGNTLDRKMPKAVAVFSFKDAADDLKVDPRVISGVVAARKIPYVPKGTMNFLDSRAMKELREILSPPEHRK